MKIRYLLIMLLFMGCEETVNRAYEYELRIDNQSAIEYNVILNDIDREPAKAGKITIYEAHEGKNRVIIYNGIEYYYDFELNDKKEEAVTIK